MKLMRYLELTLFSFFFFFFPVVRPCWGVLSVRWLVTAILPVRYERVRACVYTIVYVINVFPKL